MPKDPDDSHEVFATHLEKEIAAFAVQGYNILKRYLKEKKSLQDTCLKCGSPDITTTYCRINHDEDPRFPQHLHHGFNEKLHKTCDNCNYSILTDVIKKD